MNWLIGVLKGAVGLIRNNERRQEERRSAHRKEYDRMMDLVISANNLYTGTFPPDENRLKDAIMELRARALSQNFPQLEDAVEMFIDAIRHKAIKNCVRKKTERVVKILSDTKKRI